MMAITLTLDYNNMMKEFIGEKEGFSPADFTAIEPELKAAFDTVQQNRGKGMQGWMDIIYDQENGIVQDIKETAAKIREKFEYFVVLGIGGSALGPTAVFQSLCHLHYNDLPKEKRGGPKFYVEDNVDPERMVALLDVIEPEKTCFNVITKSGATSETMAQYLVISEILKAKLGDKFADNIIATTDAKRGNLVKLVKEHGFKSFTILDGVGGRFSELSPVGLLPAAVLGIDISELLAGARAMDEHCKEADYKKNMGLMLAALQHVAMARGKNIGVMMPYTDSLKYIADWYAQLWAESLGKSVHKDGTPAFVGQTPVKSLGVTDQHSQVQLYAEGPFDKVVTFLAVKNYRKTVVIPEGCQDIPDIHFLSGHTMNELITAEQKATAYALTVANRLNYTITLEEVNAHSVGELLYLFEMQTAFAGELLNIDTYNQPGVENGKNATYALLGKSGYEAKKAELDSAPALRAEYII
ncbi:MAG: glucose-6-phosphate isomerase [Clostridiales bacterium]|nr:glucose-6-phosphate isomerase [Clostridiales bacterium]